MENYKRKNEVMRKMTTAASTTLMTKEEEKKLLKQQQKQKTMRCKCTKKKMNQMNFVSGLIYAHASKLRFARERCVERFDVLGHTQKKYTRQLNIKAY